MKAITKAPIVPQFIAALFLLLAVPCVAATLPFAETRKAAEQGDAAAQYNLGVMYDEGKRVTRDDAEAVKWYRKAADQGHAKAQYNLGLMYTNGQGVKRDDVEAVKWFHKAADQRDASGAKQSWRRCMPMAKA